jgi:hypothetical protein
VHQLTMFGSDVPSWIAAPLPPLPPLLPPARPAWRWRSSRDSRSSPPPPAESFPCFPPPPALVIDEGLRSFSNSFDFVSGGKAIEAAEMRLKQVDDCKQVISPCRRGSDDFYSDVTRDEGHAAAARAAVIARGAVAHERRADGLRRAPVAGAARRAHRRGVAVQVECESKR